MDDSRNNTRETDELRARFTVWLNSVILRAKFKYIQKQQHRVTEISIDEIPDIFLEYLEPRFTQVENDANDFSFEEEKLANAYSSLPLMRREILRLLFVKELKADEIAKRLNCSVQHVYNQRSLALKRLRQLLSKGGDDNDKE